MQEDLSADDYPATYGGVLLCCTYTLIITGRFLFDALLRPLLHALCLSCVMVVGFVRAQPAVLMLPLHAFWTLLAIAHRRWRDLTLRHKAPYMLGVLVYGACCAIRFLVWFVSWVQCREVGCTGQVHPLSGCIASNSRSGSSERSQSSFNTPQHW